MINQTVRGKINLLTLKVDPPGQMQLEGKAGSVLSNIKTNSQDFV